MAEMREYHFAAGMLNGQIPNEVNAQQPTRDFIFNWVLKQYKDKPIRVFQVGAIETFRIDWRVGSGWADIFFGQHIKEHGGQLSIVDINLDNITHSVFAATALGYKVTPIYGDAIDHITLEEYDIYYLDGGNDPQETLDQFNAIKDRKCMVLVDDYAIMGTLLPEDLDVTVYDVANKFGVIDLRD